MQAPTLAGISAASIVFNWVGPATNQETGGSPTIHFSFQYKLASGSTWTQLTGSSGFLSTTFTQTSGVAIQTLYAYQVRAHNSAGAGSWSDTLTVFTATNPKQMQVPFSITLTPTTITIGWVPLTAANDRGNDTIVHYKLEKAESVAVPLYQEMTTFPHTTTSHTQTIASGIFPPNSKFLYRVSATNNVGYGPVSLPLEIITDTYPQGMTTIASIAVTPLSITLSWPALTAFEATGRDPITFYRVDYLSSGQWVTLNDDPSEGLYTTYTHVSTTVLPAASMHSYRVTPKNTVGFGVVDSNVLEVQADTYPQAMHQPSVVAVEPKVITIKWAELVEDSMNGRDLPVYYKVEWYSQEKSEWLEVSNKDNGKVLQFAHSVTTIFPSASTQEYRILPQNGVGWGISYSPVLSVTADEIPQQMTAPYIVTVNPSDITIKWDDMLDDAVRGRDPVTYYHVMWHDGGGNWIALTDESTTTTKQLQHTHTLPAGEIFPSNSLAYYRVCAKNGVGMGPCSAALEVQCDREPISMTPATVTLANIFPKWIYLTWSDLLDDVQNGRDRPIYYQVEWDSGTNKAEWTSLTIVSQGKFLAFNHTSTNGFPANVALYYRLIAKNRVGFGPPSAETQVQTDDIPTLMYQPLATSVIYNQIRLSWQALTDFQLTGRDVISYYSLWWDSGTAKASWLEVTLEATQGIGQTFVHTVSPRFPENTVVYYKLYAKNGVGFGPESPHLAVLTPQRPTFMPQPENVTVSAYTIKVKWASLTDFEQRGRDSITYYSLEWDQGKADWVELTTRSGGLVTTLTQTQATPFPNSTFVSYRARAENGMGWGPYSSYLVFITDRTPLQVTGLTLLSVTAKSIKISWSPLTAFEDTGRDPIVYYKVEYHDNSGAGVWTEVSNSASALTTQNIHTVSTSFPANVDRSDYFVSYRATAQNGVGLGIPSVPLQVLTATYPVKMQPAPEVKEVDITPVGIKVSWTAISASDTASTGRDLVVYYRLVMKEEGSSTEVEKTIPGVKVTTITITTGYKLNTKYYVKVQAQNGVGLGQFSDETSFISDNVPQRMNTPLEDPSTNANYVKLTWAAITDPADTGRDDILYYKVEWNQGPILNTWKEISSSSNGLRLYYEQFSGFQNGTAYRYRIVPKNRAGFGVSSTEITVVPSSKPSQMAEFYTVVNRQEFDLKISWDYPIDNGDSIKEYSIKIQGKDGFFYDQLSYCNGNTDLIVTQRFCNIPMSELKLPPFNLLNKDPIIVIGNSRNIKGWGESFSFEPMLYAFVEGVADPVGAPARGGQTNYNLLHITWTAVEPYTLAAGGPSSIILSYNLQINQGNVSEGVADLWTDLVGQSTFFTNSEYIKLDGLVAGTGYKLRVRGLNKWGWGPFGSAGLIRAAAAPAAPTQITTRNVVTSVEIGWNIPFNNGLDVTAYRVQVNRRGSSEWAEVVEECNGSDPAVFLARTCQIKMSTIRTTFQYMLNDRIKVRVMGVNLEGDGTPGEVTDNQALVQQEPGQPATTVANVVAETDDTRLSLNWAPLPSLDAKGGVEISAYEIYWTSSDVYELLFNDTYPFTFKIVYTKTDPSDTVTSAASALVRGMEYNLKYRAINIFGIGVYSPISTAIASSVPDQLDPVITSLSLTTVKVEWAPTKNDHGKEVSQYRIKFKTSAGAFIEDQSICSGSNNLVVQSLSCQIGMSKFFQAPYTLQIDDLIVATVEALNQMGWSTVSVPNTIGVNAMKQPQTAISNLARGELSNRFAVHLTWTGLFASADTGGQAVNYRIFYDKATSQTSWSLWTSSTDSATAYVTDGFKTGLLYSFKVQPFNDFGFGLANSTVLSLWVGTLPQGLRDPATSLTYLTYVSEDDIVVVDWELPTDDGGFPIIYSLEIKSKSTLWLMVDQTTECSENAQITLYTLPNVLPTLAPTQCTMLVSNLRSKYQLVAGDQVLARVTASQQVGSVRTSEAGAGTAMIPEESCFQTTFPRFIGGSTGHTAIQSMDIDDRGNIIMAGSSADPDLLLRVSLSNPLPFAVYVAKGNLYLWAKSIETNDQGTSIGSTFQSILDVTFRSDGERIACALDGDGYQLSYVIVILNKDGSLYAAFRENSAQAYGRVNFTGMIFDDQTNSLTLGLDFSIDGTANQRQAVLTRFSVNSPTLSPITPSFYLRGGSNSKQSQVFSIQRFKLEPTSLLISAMLTDGSENRRALLAKVSSSSGLLIKAFSYQSSLSSADFSSSLTFASPRRLSLYEHDLTGQQLISACILTQDGYRIIFGQFSFAPLISSTVMAPADNSLVNRFMCLGIYGNKANTAYAILNDRKAETSVDYKLYYARISFQLAKLELVPIVSHDGANNYFGAKFVHQQRIYFWGQSAKISINQEVTEFPKYVGFLNILDQQEDINSCNPIGQQYSFNGATFFSLVAQPSSTMNWVSSGLTNTNWGFIAANPQRFFRPLPLASTSLQTINLSLKHSSNTRCGLRPSDNLSLLPPTLLRSEHSLSFSPDPAKQLPQLINFVPFTPSSSTCPDLSTIHHRAYLIPENTDLPSFITLDIPQSRFSVQVTSPTHVGTHHLVLQGTLDSNRTATQEFLVVISSPCKQTQVTVAPQASPLPTWDLSDPAPLMIDVRWDAVQPPEYCTNEYFLFRIVNASDGKEIEKAFKIVQSNGVAQIRVQTLDPQHEKLWPDIKVQGYLQGDLVGEYVYQVIITNQCKDSKVQAVVLPPQIYYTGRDPIKLNFDWTESIGTCGLISYSAHGYSELTPNTNVSLDTSIMTYPRVPKQMNTLAIYTHDETKVGSYNIRVYGSIALGVYDQASIIINIQVIRDPCSYFNFNQVQQSDLTMWINQTAEVLVLPAFIMSDPIWVCNFTYQLTTPSNGQLDPIFVKNEAAPEGLGPSIQLVTDNIAKCDLSPYTIKVRGWPSRQANMVAQQYTFRVFIGYLDKRDCSTGFFYDEVTDKCQKCSSTCKTCVETPTKCTWCNEDDKFVDNGFNLCLPDDQLCPTGTIKDPLFQLCRKCPEFCLTCDSYTECTSCIPGYQLANKRCYPGFDCPIGYRSSWDSCVQCGVNCDFCLDGNSCTTCSVGFFLDTVTGICTSNCPDGYYGDEQSRVCMICQPQCATCVKNNFTCTSCKVFGGVTYYLYEKACVERCPYLGYYQNPATRRCDRCDARCLICIGAVDDCIVCQNGSFINNRKCLNDCPLSTYITDTGNCFPCNQACKGCFGPWSSQCTQCVQGFYLTLNSCDRECEQGTHKDEATLTCMACPSYCDDCTSQENCRKCKPGFKQSLFSCQGEDVLKLSPSFKQPLTLPMNQTKLGRDFNPTEVTVEVWIQAVEIFTKTTDLVVSLSPYKIRKRANQPQLNLNYESNNFCQSTSLQSGQWYHFSFSISEKPPELLCYLSGDRLSTGIIPVSEITADVQKFREITFGTSLEIKSSESKFNGYVKEFRWWNTVRTQFQIKNFMKVSYTQVPESMLVYWRLNEKSTDALLKDSSKGSRLTFNLTTLGVPPNDLILVQSISLKFCPEGTFQIFNKTLNYPECIPCDPVCKNCNGNTSNDCTDCYFPQRLLQAEQRCIESTSCPKGYFENAFLECQPCHPFCETCEYNFFKCPKCKPQYFKQGSGCIDSCPRGLYGSYLTQSCSLNPEVNILSPEDQQVVTYGEFLELHATIKLKNSEPSYTYTYGWIVKKLFGSDIDFAESAVKAKYDAPITRAHLDYNVVDPNNYYNLTFYVKGKDTFYNGMSGSLFIIVYIGSGPTKGLCNISPSQGIAGVTTFRINSTNWTDIDGIQEYTYSYSVNQGLSYIPIPTSNIRASSLNYTFPPVYATYQVTLVCRVKSLKGFYSQQTANFILGKRSIANARTDLERFSMKSAVSSKQEEAVECLVKAYQVKMIAMSLGQLREQDTKGFNPQIAGQACTDAMCSFTGSCVYEPLRNTHFCRCKRGTFGVSCSFKNSTQYEVLRNNTRDLAQAYNPLSLSGYRDYDLDFMQVITSHEDLLSLEVIEATLPIIRQLVGTDNIKVAQSNYLKQREKLGQIHAIASNMFEHLENQRRALTGNQTGVKNQTAMETKLKDLLNQTIAAYKILKNQTMQGLGSMQKEIQLQSRMVAFRQIYASQDSVINMPATQNLKKQQQSYFRMSQANFKSGEIQVGDNFIVEAIEYSFNPFNEKQSNISIASNVLEINIYDSKDGEAGKSNTLVQVRNLTVPVEIYFPVEKSQNLSEFVKIYTGLSPFKNTDILKRKLLEQLSGMSCIWWNETKESWVAEGCNVSAIAQSHIRCQCSHLTSFALNFSTPIVQKDEIVLENQTIIAKKEEKQSLRVEDLVRWPLPAYFENLGNLWKRYPPNFLTFIFKPGFAFIVLFWLLYFSSLIYYQGQDDHRRLRMTKSQNRDDLAEMQNNTVQKVYEVTRELIVRDFIRDNGRFIKKQSRRQRLNLGSSGLIYKHKQMEPPRMMIYEEMPPEQQKGYRKRARKKVFGIPGNLSERAHRYYEMIHDFNRSNPSMKINIFEEELKNNMWIGLVAKSSKISPRHVRLLMMYFYAATYMLFMTLIYLFQLQTYIAKDKFWQIFLLSILLTPAVWIFTIPVGLIFRMPHRYRKFLQGVRTKKLNKVFPVLDALMSTRYAIGYFICLSTYLLTTVVVLFFNLFYPFDYVSQWALNFVALQLLDLIVLTGLVAGVQYANYVISLKYPRWKEVWVAIQVFRYVKNLRG